MTYKTCGDANDDLAYLRQVTEAARSAPLLGGRFLIFWGMLVGAAWAGHGLVLSSGWPEAWLGGLWASFGIIAGIGMFFLRRSVSGKPGLGSIGNRVEATVWSGAGFGLLSYIGGILVAGSIGALESIEGIDTIMSVAFVVYGLAFLATAVASGNNWLRIFAALSFAGAGVIPFFLGNPAIYLFSAALVIVVAVVPGIILLIREPASLPKEDITVGKASA